MVEWMEHALCATTAPDLFTSERVEDKRAALVMCRRCQSEQKCLAWALVSPSRTGVLGGTTDRQRRVIRERRARKEAS